MSQAHRLIHTMSKLTLYHGSIIRVDKPKIMPLDSQKGFGQGF